MFTIAYQIQYDSNVSKSKEKRFTAHWFYAILSFCLFLTITFLFWEEGKNTLMQILFPQSAQITGQAIETFVQQIHNDVSLSDAIYNFCTSIINYAEIVH